MKEDAFTNQLSDYIDKELEPEEQKNLENISSNAPIVGSCSRSYVLYVERQRPSPATHLPSRLGPPLRNPSVLANASSREGRIFRAGSPRPPPSF